MFAAYLPREDIPSATRKAQLGRHRPDLAVHINPGNVNSRLLRYGAAGCVLADLSVRLVLLHDMIAGTAGDARHKLGEKS